MGTIKENYQMMFTSYSDLVDINQLKEMLGIGITLAYRLVRNQTQVWLGHSNYNTTANIYAHLDSSSMEQSGIATSNILSIKNEKEVVA